MTYNINLVEDEYLVRQGFTKLVNVAAYDMEIIGQAKWKAGLGIDPKAGARYHFNRYQHASSKWHSVGQSGTRETYPQVHLVFLTGYDDFDYLVCCQTRCGRLPDQTPFSRQFIEEMGENQSKKLHKEEKEEVTRFLLT